ncbi:conjugal transfer protein TraB [Streptomyces microflavus]|uniref:conjugal transfer protein TraB n=1 Tax=Streptomyces microflavus TaxID=1919 RepID=UPI003321C5AD
MSELVSRPVGAPAPTDGDNRYKAVQDKLHKLAGALEDSTLELEALYRSMRGNADDAEGAARDIAAADLDPRFVELTSLVSNALGGAAVEVGRLRSSAQETADLTHETRRTHATLYGELDNIRSSRREKTPKPGFFN